MKRGIYYLFFLLISAINVVPANVEQQLECAVKVGA